jgi:hypothetical protein
MIQGGARRRHGAGSLRLEILGAPAGTTVDELRDCLRDEVERRRKLIVVDKASDSPIRE